MATAYWVGNGGPWNDPLHWSSSSGGTGGTFVSGGGGNFASSGDDVILDANSFSLTGQIIRGSGGCQSFTSATVTNSPRLDVALSLSTPGGVTVNFTGLTSVAYVSGFGGGNITTGGTPIGWLGLGSGSWQLMDDLTCSVFPTNIYTYSPVTAGAISLTGSTAFTTNNHTITAAGTDFSSTTITLGTSTINIIGPGDSGSPYATFFMGSAATKNQSGATVNALVGGWLQLFGGVTIGTVRISGDARILSFTSANTINNLTIDPGTQLYITSNSTSKLTLGTLTANGTPNQPIILTRASPSYITAPSGTMTITQGKITNINVSGGATWNAVNSVDGGGNSGWNWLGGYDPVKHAGTPTHISNPSH